MLPFFVITRPVKIVDLSVFPSFSLSAISTICQISGEMASVYTLSASNYYYREYRGMATAATAAPSAYRSSTTYSTSSGQNRPNTTDDYERLYFFVPRPINTSFESGFDVNGLHYFNRVVYGSYAK